MASKHCSQTMPAPVPPKNSVVGLRHRSQGSGSRIGPGNMVNALYAPGSLGGASTLGYVVVAPLGAITVKSRPDVTAVLSWLHSGSYWPQYIGPSPVSSQRGEALVRTTSRSSTSGGTATPRSYFW